MKIKYEFATETVEVEVDEEWAKVVMELDRKEYNNDKKESRRHLMLDLSKDATAWTADSEDPEGDLLELIDDRNQLRKIMSVLNEKQRDLVKALFVKEMTQEEVAQKTGVAQAAIAQQLETIRKKIKKII